MCTRAAESKCVVIPTGVIRVGARGRTNIVVEHAKIDSPPGGEVAHNHPPRGEEGGGVVVTVQECDLCHACACVCVCVCV